MKEQIVSAALGEFGVAEIVGSSHNPQVLKYFSEIGHQWVKDDETAWCSAFMNYIAQLVGAKSSGKLNARSWLNVGKSTKEPKQGDIVVLWRVSPQDWRGHVGIFVRETPQYIYILGGNQGNRVSIKAYHKNRLLQYRDIT